jgi:hypothetical protein
MKLRDEELVKEILQAAAAEVEAADKDSLKVAADRNKRCKIEVEMTIYMVKETYRLMLLRRKLLIRIR